MKMWRLTVIALALSCAVTLAFGDYAVYFESRDFRHILRWGGGLDPPEEPVLHSIQHKIYGEEEWKDKEDCQNITARSCDLTEELSDIRNYYYARVMVDGVMQGRTPRFQPFKDTVLSPPDVSIFPGVRSLQLGVTLPTVPDESKTMADLVFPDTVIYRANLTFQNMTHKIRIIDMVTNSSEILFERLQNDTEYHVSVRYVLPVSKQSEAFQRTVKTLAVPGRRELFAIPAVLVLLIVLLALLAACQMSVRPKSPLPPSLKPIKIGAQVMPCPEDDVSIVEVGMRGTDMCEGKEPHRAPKLEADSPYTSQDCEADRPSWHCNSYSSQQGEPNVPSGSMQSSTTYSQLFIQPVGEGATGATGARKSDDPLPSGPCPGPMLNQLFLPAAPNRLDPKAKEEPGTLMLHVRRGTDNKLVLADLFPLPQMKEGEGEEGVAGMGGARGGVPSDTEAAVTVGGTSYLPNLAPPTSYARQQTWTLERVTDCDVPSEGHAPSGCGGNGEEAEALLPPSPQETDPGVGGATGGGYFAQVFPKIWGLKVQE